MTPVESLSPAALPWTLVTGALGFVGRHLTLSLMRAGLPVCGLGQVPASPLDGGGPGGFTRVGPDPRLPGADLYRCDEGDLAYVTLDLADATGLTALLDRLHPATVYHLAAQSSAAVSFTDPAGTLSVNILGTLNLLEAVRALPELERPALLVVGSAEEYGPHPEEAQPLREDAPLNPISPYGVSKAAQTLLCRQYVHSHDLPVVITRSFSHTGPGQDARFVFPSFARQIAAAERGTGPAVIRVGNLEAVRDFLDVRDVVTAYRALLKEGISGEVYHVSSGRGISIRKGLEILLDMARRPVTVEDDPERLRPSDIPYLVGDNSKLRACTGWEPERDITASLRDLLEEARKEIS